MSNENSDFNFKQIEDALEKYSEEIAGLPKLTKILCPEYLSMSLEDLRKKTIEELSEASFSISQYSIYVQRLINKNRAWVGWGKSKLDELAVGYLSEVSSNINSYERTMIARNQPEICKKINQFLRKANMELETLNNIPAELKIMSDAIRNIRFERFKKANIDG